MLVRGRIVRSYRTHLALARIKGNWIRRVEQDALWGMREGGIGPSGMFITVGTGSGWFLKSGL